MKERPIIFSAEMVRAILAGRKTQTRRIIKPQPKEMPNGWFFDNNRFHFVFKEAKDGKSWFDFCPYGQPKEKLWVRERFYKFTGCNPLLNPEFRYFADDPIDENDPQDISRWQPKPSIYMPRCASRIILEITEVRIEQLQDITDTGGMREGWRCDPRNLDYLPRIWFRDFWESIHGQGSWKKNPWVWVIEFRRFSF